jgi:hypothetical protein
MNALAKSSARLPVNYKQACDAVQKCERIDECKDWADKSAALAAYAKQADDDTLYTAAMRIKGRAIRRAGELLKEIDTPKGRPEKPGDGSRLLRTREQIEQSSGLSPDQQKQALRVAAIPARTFEKLIEADRPPTITELARHGTKPSTTHLAGRDPKEFNASIHARGRLRDLAAICAETSPAIVVRGAREYDLPELKEWVETIATWLVKLQKELSK